MLNLALLKVWNRLLSFPIYNCWERFRFHSNDAVNQYQKLKIWITEVPCENHQGLSVVGAGRELCSVGLQRSQTQLEDGFDTMEEETVDHADGAVEGQHAEEEGEEPREGDRGQGGQVRDVFSQLRQTLPDQLLKHRLVHLSSCGSRTRRSVFVCVWVISMFSCVLLGCCSWVPPLDGSKCAVTPTYVRNVFFFAVQLATMCCKKNYI